MHEQEELESVQPPPDRSSSAPDARRTQSASALSAIKIQLPVQPPPAQQRTPSPTTPTTMTGSSARDKAPAMLAAMGRSSSNFLAMSSNFFMGAAQPRDDRVTTVTIEYDEPGPLYVDLYSRPDHKGAYVKAFRRAPDGTMGRAEASGRVHIKDELYAINGCIVTDLLLESIIHAVKSAAFPLTLVFRSSSPDQLLEPLQPVLRSRSAQLPPVSPAQRSSRTTSFSSEWTAKLGQMMAESGRKRSSSFEKKLERPSGGATGTSSPTSSSSADSPHAVSKPKQPWSDSLLLDKMKHSGTDGMKNLLRLIGGKARPEEDRETVNMWFEQLLLRPDSSSSTNVASDGTAMYHSTPLVTVTAGGRVLAVRDDDATEFAVSWYRKTVDDELIHIKGATTGRYHPSVDDVGAKLSAHVASLRFPPLARVVECMQPLVIDPAVRELVDALLDAGAGAFSATLASHEPDSFQLRIASTRVALVKISEHDDDAGVIVDALYSAHVQVLLDPTDSCRFILKVKEFGSFLGNRKGDTCGRRGSQQRSRLHQTAVADAFADYSCFFLVAPNAQHRDSLALLIRTFRARAIAPELEHQAHRDELNLFMDPAFACASLGSASPERQSSSGSTGANASTLQQPHAATSGTSASSSPSAHANSVGAAGGAGPAGRSSVSSLDAVHTQRSAIDAPQSVSASIIELFSLDTDNEAADAAAPEAVLSSREQLVSNRSPTASTTTATLATAPDVFLQSRVAAQESQLAMLQDKLSALAVQLQATEHEKKALSAAVEVKDTRIEAQQSKLAALEKLAAVHAMQTRELQTLRAKAEDDDRMRASLQQQLDAALAALAATRAQQCDAATQTDSSSQRQQAVAAGTDGTDGWVDDDIASQLSPRSINFEMDYMAAALAKTQQQLVDRTRDVAALQDATSSVVAERNAFRAKADALAAELRTLVTANRSLADIATQLDERQTLATQLAVAKAEAKRASDEATEYKDALACVLKQRGMGDKDKDTQRVLSQNLDLQRVVHQLTDSLHDTKDQLAAMKRINGALVDKLHVLQPEARGSIVVDSPDQSRSSVTSARAAPTFSTSSDSEDDDSEDDDSDSDDEGFAGTAVTDVITHAL